MPMPIEGRGTAEAVWCAWDGLVAAPTATAETLLGTSGRAWIVSPHPDDEVLALGGTIAALAQAGHTVTVVSVSDGEACYPGSRFWTRETLARVRAHELRLALNVLARSIEVVRMEIPDGELSLHERRLTCDLTRMIRPGDTVFSTWQGDGHPDHEAAGRACAKACSLGGARHIELPVWTWHWAAPAHPAVPWKRLVRIALDPHLRESKQAAILRFKSQIHIAGTDIAQPILPPWVLERFARPYEAAFV